MEIASSRKFVFNVTNWGPCSPWNLGEVRGRGSCAHVTVLRKLQRLEYWCWTGMKVFKKEISREEQHLMEIKKTFSIVVLNKSKSSHKLWMSYNTRVQFSLSNWLIKTGDTVQGVKPVSWQHRVLKEWNYEWQVKTRFTLSVYLNIYQYLLITHEHHMT